MEKNYFVLDMPDAEKEYHARCDCGLIPEVHLELGQVYAGAFQWPKAEEEFRAR